MCLSKFFGLFRRPKEVRVPVDDVITPTDALSITLVDLIRREKFPKFYKTIDVYLKMHPAKHSEGVIGGMHGVTFDELSRDAQDFVKRYKLLKIKCNDEEFDSWIKNLI